MNANVNVRIPFEGDEELIVDAGLVVNKVPVDGNWDGLFSGTVKVKFMVSPVVSAVVFIPDQTDGDELNTVHG